jgi:hypothetical protein
MGSMRIGWSVRSRVDSWLVQSSILHRDSLFCDDSANAARESVVLGARVMRGPGQDVQAEVAAAFDPFIVLLGQDRADEADQGVAAPGKIPTTAVRRRISRFSRSCGLCRTHTAARV